MRESVWVAWLTAQCSPAADQAQPPAIEWMILWYILLAVFVPCKLQLQCVGIGLELLQARDPLEVHGITARFQHELRAILLIVPQHCWGACGALRKGVICHIYAGKCSEEPSDLVWRNSQSGAGASVVLAVRRRGGRCGAQWVLEHRHHELHGGGASNSSAAWPRHSAHLVQRAIGE